MIRPEPPAVGAAHGRTSGWPFHVAFGLLVLFQGFLCFLGLNDQWLRGHLGWNASAYLQAARNTLRWHTLFPVEFYTGRIPPSPDMAYTHHPLAMHLHNVGSLWLFGDSPAAIRLVPAIHGVAALIALVLVVRRFYGPTTALLAGAVYVITPINAIYANMMNHSSGFIFWSLLAFYCYLRFQDERASVAGSTGGARPRWRRWYALLFLTYFMAASWDWPAYYIAFVMALHWLVIAQTREKNAGRSVWHLGSDSGLVALFGLFVLLLFAGHFALVMALVGSWSELNQTFYARAGVGWPHFATHLRIVPELMFTWVLLGLCGLWLLGAVSRIATRRHRNRDLIPLAYAFGGVVHYTIFKSSAIAHSYWAWTLLPFVAIASSSVVVGLGRWLRRVLQPFLAGRLGERRGRTMAGVLALSSVVLLVPLAQRSIDLVPRGRRVGGSMWFIEPVRGPVTEIYDSGRPELRFAERVREWTTRGTGVLIHASMEAFRPEPRFTITLDREVRSTPRIPPFEAPDLVGVSEGWVFIAAVQAVNRETRAALAAYHPYYEYGDYFMVDLRSDRPEVRIWALEPQPVTLAWWFWHSPFEGPVRAVRQPVREQALEDEIREIRYGIVAAD